MTRIIKLVLAMVVAMVPIAVLAQHAAAYDWPCNSNTCWTQKYTPNNQAYFNNADSESAFGGTLHPNDPIQFILENNSSLATVQLALQSAGYYNCDPYTGSPPYCSRPWEATTENCCGYGTNYEYTGGFKSTTPTCSNWDKHVRVYGTYGRNAPGLYDPAWGYFNVASAHIDRYDTTSGGSPCPGRAYGWSAEAQGNVYNDIVNYSGFDATKSHRFWVSMQSYLHSNDPNNSYSSLYGACGGAYNFAPYDFTNYGYWAEPSGTQDRHCLESTGQAAWIFVK